jgi:hypothetical protein
MANPIPFDLNAEIQAWRNSLSASPELRPENLDELESHLRDSVAALRDQGLTDAEAFLIATQRIGSPTALQPEFAKVNAREVWLDRLLWMALGICFWIMILRFSRLASTWLVIGGLMTFGYDFKFAPGQTWTATLVILLAVAQIAMLSLSIWFCLWLVRRGQRGPLAWISRIALRPRSLWILVSLLCVAFLGTQFAGNADMMVFRNLSIQQATVFQMSKSWSMASVAFAETIALMVVTAILLRRFFRSKARRTRA